MHCFPALRLRQLAEADQTLYLQMPVHISLVYPPELAWVPMGAYRVIEGSGGVAMEDYRSL